MILTVSCCLQAETVPLGVVFKGERTLLELQYTNKGKAPVHITQVSPSCDCIEVLQMPGEVRAGETIRIPLAHHASNVGTVAVTVRLEGDPASAVIETDVIAGVVADRSWLLSPREAQGRGLVLVDARNQEPFDRLHATGAINIPAFALKTRNDLRASKLVLMDDGVSPVDLLAEVATLRSQGFSQVFALNGGLPAWIRQGGRVEGATKSVLAVARISAADFARASRTGKWQVVEIGDASTSLAETVDVIKLGETDDIGRSLASLLKESAQRMPPNILIIAPNNGRHAGIEAHLGKAGQLPVFYLNDGAKALAFFHNEQIEAARNSGQLFRTRQAQGSPVIAGGCGSCGK